MSSTRGADWYALVASHSRSLAHRVAGPVEVVCVSPPTTSDGRTAERQRHDRPPADRAPIGVIDREHRAGSSQAEIVHHMVDEVVVRLRLDPAHDRPGHPLVELDGDVLTRELGAVHGPIGVGCLPVTQGSRQFQQRVVVRRPAERGGAAPARVEGMDGDAAAVLVVVGVRPGATRLHVAGRGQRPGAGRPSRRGGRTHRGSRNPSA